MIKKLLPRFALLILIAFSIIAGSCSNRKNKLDGRNLIPEKELVTILTDLYITDGLLSLPKIHHWFPSMDSSSTYFHIIEKHGYTKKTMDKTMKYYFIKEPKKLIRIYDQVLGIISEMESIVDKEALLAEGHKENLWTGKQIYTFPDPGGTDSVQFNIPLNKTGLYVLSFSATLFPDDQSVNPRITAYSCYADSIETGKRKYFETINYIKDGHLHNYSFIIKVPENTTVILRGCFYDFDNNPDAWEKHMSFSNISLSFMRVSV